MYIPPYQRRSCHRPGATWGIPGPCPPKRKLCSPKRGLCSEEINRLGASGVQIEALDSKNSVNRRRNCEQELIIHNFCGLTPDYIKLRVYFGTRNFFLVSTFFCLIHTFKFTQIKFSFPQKMYLCPPPPPPPPPPPSHAILAPGLSCQLVRMKLVCCIVNF